MWLFLFSAELLSPLPQNELENGYRLSTFSLYLKWKKYALTWKLEKDHIKEIILPLDLTKDGFTDLLILREGKIWRVFKLYMECTFKTIIIVDGKTDEVLYFFDGELAPIFFIKIYGANCWKCVGPGMEDWEPVNFKVLWPTFSHFLKNEQQRLRNLTEKIKERKIKQVLLQELNFEICSSKWKEVQHLIHKLKKIKVQILNYLNINHVTYHFAILILVGKKGFTISTSGLFVSNKDRKTYVKSLMPRDAKNKIQWLEWKDAWPFGGLIYIDHFEWNPEKGAFYGYTDVP